jgi:Xaa-Pro aminopeptidase
MTLHELERTKQALREAGIDLAVFSSVANVTYVTGIEVPVPIGAGAELTWGPWLAVVPAREAGGTLISPGGAGQGAVANGFTIVGFEGFDSFDETDPEGTYIRAITDAALQYGGAAVTGVLGIEARSLPVAAHQAVSAALPRWRVADAEGPVRQARWIKTPREIALLRRASHLADVAHSTLARLCRTAGSDEFTMFAEISRAVFAAAGRDIPLTGELVTGPRTTTVEYPNGPRTRTTRAGDAALMDLSGRIDGYWFDCTSIHVIAAEPTAEQRRYGLAAQAACDAAMAALVPGAKTSDAFAASARAFRSFGLEPAHYAGHQIGVTVNEHPRLVPYDHRIIEPGMVFSVEPGVYMGPGGDFGARAEKMALVTESGPEVLSTFTWGIV